MIVENGRDDVQTKGTAWAKAHGNKSAEFIWEFGNNPMN